MDRSRLYRRAGARGISRAESRGACPGSCSARRTWSSRPPSPGPSQPSGPPPRAKQPCASCSCSPAVEARRPPGDGHFAGNDSEAPAASATGIISRALAAQTPDLLLERDEEVAQLRDALDATAAGTGALVVIEGEPGIGKTALLRRGLGLAAERGFDVLTARGGELERPLTFGIARQLLERRAHDDPALFAGAARHAAPLLGVGSAAETDEPALVHALFWACANLAAARQPGLVVAIDDGQWADDASLRWLVSLARRLDELPVALLVSVSTGEPDAPARLLQALATQPRARRLVLGPLSADAAGTLVRDTVGADADEALVRAAHEAAAGNPLLIREAAATLAAEGADHIPALRAEAVVGSALRRLDQLPGEAATVARAVSVLGPDASLAHTTALAEVDAEAASVAADRLAGARILDPGRPLAFTHPLLRSTLYAAMPEGERSRAHARAARLLA